MWVYDLNPVLVDLGPLEIRWYGLVYVLGFLLGVWWLNRVAAQGKLAISKDEVWDLLLYLIIGVLVGARLFMVFWNPEIYLLHPFNLLKIWEGGMSFHGGFLGIITAAWLYCRKKKLNFWTVADVLSVPAILALALGRIANFINGELIGRIWNGSWCVVFPEYGEACRHPNMIYSALQRLVVFGWLLWISAKNEFRPGQVTGVRDLSFTPFRPGFIFWNFVFWEGIGRIIVDFFREDILYGGFSLGQWFSLVMVIVAVIVFARRYREDWKGLLMPKSLLTGQK